VSEYSPSPEGGAQPLQEADLASAKRLTDAYQTIREEMSKVIVGQEQVLQELLICIFARGHAILEGVPGLAKTLIVSSLAQCLDLNFTRIQFTPDLMPSDITGTEVIQENRSTGQREFRFLRGPVFSNIILADEINRTPPKTQAALLEAMQERQVSVGGNRLPMEDPFFVLATQNPIEQEGTYPLPEAQQDRFMFKIFVSYPSWDEELDVIRRTTAHRQIDLDRVLSGEEIKQIQDIILQVPVADEIIGYAMRLVRATRVFEGESASENVPDVVKQYLSWGAGPRACQYLVLAGKVRAVLEGRFHVAAEDIQAVAKPVLRHRIVTNFNADAEGFTADRVIDALLDTVPVHAPAVADDPSTAGALS
jgi:MoxR-like ATPase